MDGYTTTIRKDEKCTVIVHRPILTDEERSKRLEEIKKAAIKLLVSKWTAEAKAEAKCSAL